MSVLSDRANAAAAAMVASLQNEETVTAALEAYTAEQNAQIAAMIGDNTTFDGLVSALEAWTSTNNAFQARVSTAITTTPAGDPAPIE